jgi:hypothetical protein
VRRRLGLGAATLLVISLLGTYAAPARAQQAPAAPDSGFQRQRTIYAEVLGSGDVYSLNYDVRVSPGAALRAGVASWGVGSGVIAFPLTASSLIGRGELSLEIGAGPMFVTGVDVSDFGSNVILISFAAFRVQPRDGHVFARAGIEPLFGGGNWEVWPTFAAGYTF